MEYRRLVAALTAASARRAADLADAERAYADAVAEAEAELAALTAAAEHAERWAAGAAAAVVTVDREADRLWAELRRVLGWRGALLGDTPAAAEPAGAAGPVLLARAARAVAALRSERDRRRAGRSGGGTGPRGTGPRGSGRGTGREVRRPLPRWAVALLPVLGATAAAAVALAAGGLVTLGRLAEGSAAGDALRATGWLVFLAAPFAGVPAAATLARRRFAARPDAGGIGLTVVAGMVAASAIALALH